MTTFDTKEQYLAFRSAWAKAAQAKSITSAHMVLFNVLCGRPMHVGFTPVTSPNKLSNGTAINGALCSARSQLSADIRRAKEALAPYQRTRSYEQRHYEWAVRMTNDLVQFFDGTVSAEMIAKLDIPFVEFIEPSFGKGRQIAQAIIDGKFKPTTMAELEDWTNEQ